MASSRHTFRQQETRIWPPGLVLALAWKSMIRAASPDIKHVGVVDAVPAGGLLADESFQHGAAAGVSGQVAESKPLAGKFQDGEAVKQQDRLHHFGVGEQGFLTRSWNEGCHCVIAQRFRQ